MRRQIFALVIAVSLALACAWLVVHRRSRAPVSPIPDLSRTSPLNRPGGGELPAEDYEPYSDLYQHQASDDPLAFAADSFADIPQLNGSCLHPSNAEERDMADAFASGNRQSHRWQRLFAISQGYKLLTADEVHGLETCLDTHFEDRNRCAAYSSIRHVRFLGVPGFNRTHTHALVSVMKEFGSHRGTGGIFEVEKTASGWRRADTTDFTRDCSWMY